MALTPKQDRNGVTVEGGTQSQDELAMPSATPGDLAGLMGQSQSAAEVRGGEGHDLINSPAGSGTAGHEVGGYGAMFEWDAGLAINDVEGGGSG